MCADSSGPRRGHAVHGRSVGRSSSIQQTPLAVDARTDDVAPQLGLQPFDARKAALIPQPPQRFDAEFPAIQIAVEIDQVRFYHAIALRERRLDADTDRRGMPPLSVESPEMEFPLIYTPARSVAMVGPPEVVGSCPR